MKNIKTPASKVNKNGNAKKRSLLFFGSKANISRLVVKKIYADSAKNTQLATKLDTNFRDIVRDENVRLDNKKTEK